MDDTAVVSRLVLPDGLLLFKDYQAQGWKARQQFHGSSEPHDPCADYRDVISLFGHARTPSYLALTICCPDNLEYLLKNRQSYSLHTQLDIIIPCQCLGYWLIYTFRTDGELRGSRRSNTGNHMTHGIIPLEEDICPWP